MQVASDKVKVLMEKQDFLSALDELTLPSSLDLPLGDEGKEEGTRRDPSSEALRLAALHDFFGHKSATDASTVLLSRSTFIRLFSSHDSLCLLIFLFLSLYICITSHFHLVLPTTWHVFLMSILH